MDTVQNTALDRLAQVGYMGVSLHDLLAVMVSREERDVPTNERHVHDAFRHWDIARLSDLAEADLGANTSFGLEPHEVRRLLCAVAFGRKGERASQGARESPVTNDQDAWRIFADLADQKQEHFCAAYFDSKARLIVRRTIHVGTLNMSVVGAREVFREAVRVGAASLIVAHNHPSGDPEPSPEDCQVTSHLQSAGELLDVVLLDHLVIGHNGAYVSLAKRGAL